MTEQLFLCLPCCELFRFISHRTGSSEAGNILKSDGGEQGLPVELYFCLGWLRLEQPAPPGTYFSECCLLLTHCAIVPQSNCGCKNLRSSSDPTPTLDHRFELCQFESMVPSRSRKSGCYLLPRNHEQIHAASPQHLPKPGFQVGKNDHQCWQAWR